jgi:hypothetical protein
MECLDHNATMEPRPFGCLALGAGILLVLSIGSIWNATSKLRNTDSRPAAPGVITKIHEYTYGGSSKGSSARSRGKTYVHVAYVVDGKPYEWIDEDLFSTQYHKGDHVTVHYTPGDPATARVDELLAEDRQSDALSAAFWATLALPASIAWIALRRQQRERRTAENQPQQAAEPSRPLTRRERRQTARDAKPKPLRH